MTDLGYAVANGLEIPLRAVWLKDGRTYYEFSRFFWGKKSFPAVDHVNVYGSDGIFVFHHPAGWATDLWVENGYFTICFNHKMQELVL